MDSNPLLHTVVEVVGSDSNTQVSVTLFEDKHAAFDYALALALEIDAASSKEELIEHLNMHDEHRVGNWGVFLTDAAVSYPSMTQYMITVKVTREAGVTDDDLDDDDREQQPEGEYTFNPLATSLRAAKEKALDDFHKTVPIGVLENYIVEATSIEDEVPKG